MTCNLITSLKHKGIRAIVSVAEPDLSTFLGDAENPAHTEWERNSKKFKRKYRLGPTSLDYVKTSPREIVKILTQPQKGRDENLLKHIFSLPEVQLDQLGINEKEVAGQADTKKNTAPFVDVLTLMPVPNDAVSATKCPPSIMTELPVVR